VLNPDFRDMLSALSDEGADYLLVGAYAVAVHGIPRATGDLDLWVRVSAQNAARVLRALARTHVEVEGLRIPVISRADLVRNKKAVGRPQDLADVARLESEASDA